MPATGVDETMTTPQITALPPAPTPQDSPEAFNDKAFRVLAAQEAFVEEANELAEFVNQKTSDAAAASVSAGQAAQSAEVARDDAIAAKNVVVGVASQFGDVGSAIAFAEDAAQRSFTQAQVATNASQVAELARDAATVAKNAAVAAEQSIDSRAEQITTDATLAAVGAVTTQVESARDVAVAAKDGAELARDAAIAAAGPLYATEAEGRAAVADGESFNVQGVGDVAAYQYRRNSAAVSTLLSVYPASRAVDRAAAIPSHNDLLRGTGNYETQPSDDITPIVTDEVGNVGIGIRRSGKLFADLDLGDAQMFAQTLADDYSLVICDELGYVCAAWDTAGAMVYPKLSAVGAGQWVAALTHLIIRGQSLSLGYNSQEVITTTDSWRSRKLAADVRSSAFTGLQPLVETINGMNAESPASGLAGHIKDALLGRFTRLNPLEADPSVIVSIHGVAGASITSLNAGTASFTAAGNAMTAAKEYAELEGLEYTFGGMIWIQGEADERDRMPAATYKNHLMQLYADHKAQAQAALGKPVRFPFLTYQTNHRYQHNTPIVALAQRDSARENRDIFLATPIYMLDVTDHVHLTAHSSRWLGEQLGKVWKRIVVDGEEWKPLQINSARAKDAATVVVRFDVPRPPLAWDTEVVTDPGNKGFEVADVSGAVPITSVEITGTDEVTIKLGRALSTSPVVRTAYTSYGSNAGRLTGARCLLRDSDSEVSAFTDATGKPYPLYNWCITDEKTIEV